MAAKSTVLVVGSLALALLAGSVKAEDKSLYQRLGSYDAPRENCPAAAISSAAMRNGAPGCMPCPAASDRERKDLREKAGPNKLAIPVTLALAPCNWPCSEAPTRRLIKAMDAGPSNPHNASSGIPMQNSTPVRAKANTRKPDNAERKTEHQARRVRRLSW